METEQDKESLREKLQQEGGLKELMALCVGVAFKQHILLSRSAIYDHVKKVYLRYNIDLSREEFNKTYENMLSSGYIGELELKPSIET